MATVFDGRSTAFARRGQSMPFWVLATLMALALTFLIYNYAQMVRWQIRAQNAADSAAVALLASDAQSANSLNTLLYALSLNDFKLSMVESAITNLTTNQPFCLTNSVCSQSYSALISDYSRYALEAPTIISDITSLGTISDTLGLGTKSQPARNTFATGLLGALLPQNGSGGLCVDISTDCGFTYSVAVVSSSPLVVDVVSCTSVPILAAGILHLPNGSFKAVGRATMKLAPLNDVANTGTLVNGLGSYAQANGILPQIPLGSVGLGLGTINLFNLQATTGYLIPTPTSPLTTANVPC